MRGQTHHLSRSRSRSRRVGKSPPYRDSRQNFAHPTEIAINFEWFVH
jgi:hypothetical protein